LDDYAPLPTGAQLAAVSDGLGRPVDYGFRIFGGAGGTVDVLVDDNGEKVVLKRYWFPEEDEEVNPAQSEFRALTLAAERGVPAPVPYWIDETGIFPERAVVTSFVEGRPLLDPTDELDWAEQLAGVLHVIHDISPEPDDADLFPALGHDDEHRPWPETMEVVREHPRGEELWGRFEAGRTRMVPEDPVYVHHDFWPGNTMWVDQRLVAVIDWEGGCLGDPALDVAYCVFDIRMLGLERAASHLIDTYRHLSRRPLPNLDYWYLQALACPLPDIAIWVPGWQSLGFEISEDEARARHNSLIDDFLDGD
jgi:aminoglycoside phosphotransferase (APT) family kinase protein